MTTPPADFKPLSNALSACPPLPLLSTCENADQSDAYIGYQKIFVDLNQSLICYFGGLPLPTYTDKGYQSLIRLQLSAYLKLYEVIFFGWKYLPKKVSESPGDFLQEIIKADCKNLQDPWSDAIKKMGMVVLSRQPPIQYQWLHAIKKTKRMPPQLRSALRAYEQALSDVWAHILSTSHPKN